MSNILIKENEVNTVILDCYTDEPSGYGARPFLGSHQIHLSQALSYKKIKHRYLTIDDLRHNTRNVKNKNKNVDISTLQITKNSEKALEIINSADIIYIVMGCFVDYKYFSCVPPKSDEIYDLIKNSKAKKVLFYVIGVANDTSKGYENSKLSKIIDRVVIGNTYRFILNDNNGNILLPNYELLAKISSCPVQIIEQLRYPIIAEIETGTGCNTPTCSYCIESHRKLKISYRDPRDIIRQIKSLYNSGVRHFRLGRQPNFYHYQWQNIEKLKELLSGIRESCPNIKTLHIDNANMIDVIKPNGIEFTKLIVKYCTSGNVAPFGIESFDNRVRFATNITGKADDVLRAIEVLNLYGQEKGDDGFQKLLPGINLMHGLPGQTQQTFEINLEYLNKILKNGFQTQRLFYRRMTRPTGVSFEDGPEETDLYKKCYDDIMKEFVMPMQNRVFPKDHVLKNFREVVFQDGVNTLRTLGTCSIKVMVEKKVALIPYNYYNIKIKGHIFPRVLEGELVK